MYPSLRAGRRLPVACAAAAGLLLLAACSSSGPGGSGTSPAGAGGTTSPATAGSAGGGGSRVAAAQSFVTRYEHRPSRVNVPPLAAAPKPGGTIVFTNDGTPQQGLQWDGLQQAAALVGWKAVSIPFDVSNQPSLNSGMDSALTLSPKPVAVVVSGVPPVVWAKEIPKYAAAGVAIISFAAPTEVSGPVKVNIQGAGDSALWGKLLADWAIADSGGKASVLLVNWPDIGTFKALGASAAATFKSGCPACSVTPLNLSLAQLASGSNDPVVSALQSHPDIRYVLTPYGQPLAGLNAALQTAGISGVKVAGANPTPQQLQDLADGAATAGAWVSSPYAATGYLLLDAALRIAAGVPLPDGDGGTPVVLLTKDNIGTGTVTDAAQEVPDNYKTLYAAAWKVPS
jgi:ribose transport system substrate-binding protein